MLSFPLLASLLLLAPLAVSHPQGQPGQTGTTTKSEIAVTAAGPSGKTTLVKFPGIPGLKGVPKCGADNGLDAQKTSADEVFCRTLRGELAKAGGADFADIAKGGEIKVVGFASSESTSTSGENGGNGGNGGNGDQNGGNGGNGGNGTNGRAGGAGGNGGSGSNGSSAAPVTSSGVRLVTVQSIVGAGLVVAGALAV